MRVYEFGPLVQAKLIRRYKRFLADVELPSGEVVTAHCPNPGRMSSILPDPEAVYLTDLSQQPGQRKLSYRWELAKVDSGFVVVNTQLANKVAAALLSRHSELREQLGLDEQAIISAEYSVARDDGKKTRFDFCLNPDTKNACYLEVKQVSLRAPDADSLRWAAFPDAVTARGRRHLLELAALKEKGAQTALLYIVGRDDVDRVRPAYEIDPDYSEAFEQALEAGVQVIACKIRADLDGLHFEEFLPVECARPILS